MESVSPDFIDSLVSGALPGRVHFVGIGGVGMSGYAWFHHLSGGAVSGSDRSFDQGKLLQQKAAFEAAGITIFPQDGSGVAGAVALVASPAVEPQVPEMVQARALGVPVITRPQWLSAYYRTRPCVAITGTSGKSTVTAMVFECLKAAGADPALMTGADLVSLTRAGLPGSSVAGAGPLVLEADESDKGIGAYTPAVGVILNLQRDHDEPEAMKPAFAAFKNGCRQACVVSDDPALDFLRDGCITVGRGGKVQHKIDSIELRADGSSFTFDGVSVTLPVPGLHNIENAAMALATGLSWGADLAPMVLSLAVFAGTARRFEKAGTLNGAEVFDDYAHNPAKIAAAIKTAQARAGAGGRVFAYFQPHGFGPTRFMRPDLVAALADVLRPQDSMFFSPIYYAGGTVAQDISSGDLVADIAARGGRAELSPSRADFAARMAAESRAGDLILIMGARDSSLSDFAKGLCD